MYKRILQRLIKQFFVTKGRAPSTAMEWAKLRARARALAGETPDVTSKTTQADMLSGPHISRGGPKGDRIWDFSQKKGEVIPFPDKGIRGLLRRGDVTVGTAPKTTKETLQRKKESGILFRDAQDDISRIKRENKEAIRRFKEKMDKDTVEDLRDKGDWDPYGMAEGGIAPLIGEPSYAADFYDDRTPMKEGKKTKKKKKKARPEELPPFQGPEYETDIPKEAAKEILSRYLGSGIVGAPLPGGFSLDMPYGTNKEFDIGIGYGTDPGSSDFSAGYGVNLEGEDIMGARYQGDNFDIGVKKREGSDPTFGLTWKKKFDQGGIARIGLAGGGAAVKVWKKFVEKLFKEEMTKPTFRNLHPNNKEWAKRQVENYNKKLPGLTKKYEEFKKTGKLPEDMHVDDIFQKEHGISSNEYFGGYDTKKLRKKEVDYDYYREILDDAENDIVQGDETLEHLEALVKERHDYHDYMYDQYKTGKLDKYMSMEAKVERVRSADDAGRPSGYSPEEEMDIRYAADEMDRIAVAKVNEADELAKSKESPWFTDPKILSPEDQLRKEFPGIDDKMIRNILTDKNPQRIAEVKATMREALKMKEKMSVDEIIDIFKKTPRTKNASGGLAGILGV